MAQWFVTMDIGNGIALEEGDRIEVATWIRQSDTSYPDWVRGTNLNFPYSLLLKTTNGKLQSFHGNESITQIDLTLIEGQYIRWISILDSGLKITFFNRTSIVMPIAESAESK